MVKSSTSSTRPVGPEVKRAGDDRKSCSDCVIPNCVQYSTVATHALQCALAHGHGVFRSVPIAEESSDAFDRRLPGLQTAV